MYNQLNKTLYISAIIFLLSASAFVACQSKEEKAVEEAAEAISEINVETNTSSDWKSYKESADATITNNQERIKTLRERIQKSNTPNLDKLREKRINELQDRNTVLRAKVIEYKEEDTSINLAQLKADIQKELDDLEKALKELDEK